MIVIFLQYIHIVYSILYLSFDHCVDCCLSLSPPHLHTTPLPSPPQGTHHMQWWPLFPHFISWEVVTKSGGGKGWWKFAMIMHFCSVTTCIVYHGGEPGVSQIQRNSFACFLHSCSQVSTKEWCCCFVTMFVCVL
jgi:hypothetical protein